MDARLLAQSVEVVVTLLNLDPHQKTTLTLKRRLYYQWRRKNIYSSALLAHITADNIINIYYIINFPTHT